jgi:hypothetical protein
MPRKNSFPLRLRPETRTAVLMLAEIHREGDDSRNTQGLQFWINDLVDAVTAKQFFDTFGISVSAFLARCKSRRDPALREEARRLLARRFAVIDGDQATAGT